MMSVCNRERGCFLINSRRNRRLSCSVIVFGVIPAETDGLGREDEEVLSCSVIVFGVIPVEMDGLRRERRGKE